jgi:peptide/nickel transport system permease protein
VTALNIAYLIGGVVVVEKVFSFPGFGSLLVDALMVRDVPLIQITVLIAAATYIAANLIADLGAILLNPKLRT